MKVPSEKAELAWMKDVDHAGNSYLVLVNHSGQTIKKGEQIMFYYGKYTNAYLLLNYGFSYRDNKYDQFDISLRMRPASQTPQDIVEWNWEKCTDIQLVSLKVDKIDPTLICYLRLLIQAESMFQTDQ